MRLRWRGGLAYLGAIAPFVLPVVTCCSGMAALSLEAGLRDAGEVQALELADPARVPSGAHVGANVDLTGIGPFDAVLVVRGAPTVLVYKTNDRWRRLPNRGHFEGRLCDLESFDLFACNPEPEDRRQVEDAAQRLGLAPSAVRVWWVGESQVPVRVGSGCTFAGLGLILALVLFGFVAVIRDGRQGPARIVRDRAWTLPIAPDSLAARIASLRDDGARVIERTADRCVIVQGRKERSARFWGLRAAQHMPRRIELRWRDAGPYQSLHVEARVEEDLVWLGKLAPPLEKLLTDALDRSIAQLERALGAQP